MNTSSASLRHLQKAANAINAARLVAAVDGPRTGTMLREGKVFEDIELGNLVGVWPIIEGDKVDDLWRRSDSKNRADADRGCLDLRALHLEDPVYYTLQALVTPRAVRHNDLDTIGPPNGEGQHLARPFFELTREGCSTDPAPTRFVHAPASQRILQTLAGQADVKEEAFSAAGNVCGRPSHYCIPDRATRRGSPIEVQPSLLPSQSQLVGKAKCNGATDDDTNAPAGTPEERPRFTLLSQLGLLRCFTCESLGMNVRERRRFVHDVTGIALELPASVWT